LTTPTATSHLGAKLRERKHRARKAFALMAREVEIVARYCALSRWSFDLGETAKVVMVSVTEGDDKPRKYPQMLRAATVVLLNKVDLLPYVPFDSRSFLRARSSTQFQRARVHAVGAHRAGDGGVVRLGAVAILAPSAQRDALQPVAAGT